jgi:hypothetical protein
MADDHFLNKMVPIDEAEEQVVKTAKRLALLFHYTAEVLVEKFGEKEGRELLHEIINRYGRESGAAARAKVKALDLPLTAENFDAGSDLPKWGWQMRKISGEDGIERGSITYCPLAEVWQEKGSEKIGRIYCYVDQAKYDAYNGIKCKHLKNLLDGDNCCLFDFEL